MLTDYVANFAGGASVLALGGLVWLGFYHPKIFEPVAALVLVLGGVASIVVLAHDTGVEAAWQIVSADPRAVSFAAQIREKNIGLHWALLGNVTLFAFLTFVWSFRLWLKPTQTALAREIAPHRGQN